MLRQHLVKLGAAFGTAAVSLGLTASSAFAGSTTIYNTGNCFHYSNNHHSNMTTIRVTNNNYAHINQFSINYANTGYNMMNRNIGGGYIHTGSAMVNNYFSANANMNWTSISY